MTGLFSALLLAALGQSQAAEIGLTDNCAVRFADADRAKEILTTEDAFTASLSRFDLQCRLKADREVTLADWKKFVAENVRSWAPEESDKVRQGVERLRGRLTEYRLPLPPLVELVRTTGEEESGAAYTRGNAIALPMKVMGYDTTQLDRLLAHELFHILSRHDGAARAKLYSIIGFSVCDPIELPASLSPRRITNPDAPLIDCTITLDVKEGGRVTAAPVLYSSTKDYDAKRSPSLFQSLVFRLLVVENRSGRWQPILFKGEPVVIDPKKEPAFQEKIGKNTNYIIHPDEILADNFVRLVMGDKDLATPRIVEEMRQVLVKR